MDMELFEGFFTIARWQDTIAKPLSLGGGLHALTALVDFILYETHCCPLF